MTRGRIGIAASAIVALALLLVSCGSAGEAPSAASQADATEQTEEEARVQVIRGRAMLGDPNAPVVIQEYSDFL